MKTDEIDRFVIEVSAEHVEVVAVVQQVHAAVASSRIVQT